MTEHTHNAYDIYDVADQYHRHYDEENLIEGLRSDFNGLQDRVHDLETEVESLKADRKADEL